MNLRAAVLRHGLPCLLIAGSSLAVSRAGEPNPADLKMPAWVAVKPGAVAPPAPRPIEPTSFAVDVGKVAPGARVPLELEIRNTSAEPIRIMGGGSGCLSQGCVKVTGQYPSPIAPGATGKFAVLFIAPKETQVAIGRRLEIAPTFYVAGKTTFVVSYKISGEMVAEARLATAQSR